jgi:hypothetical protein
VHPPKLLSANEVAKLRLLSRHPVERIESKWWEVDRGHRRDYFFAVTNQGECLWVFRHASDDVTRDPPEPRTSAAASRTAPAAISSRTAQAATAPVRYFLHGYFD